MDLTEMEKSIHHHMDLDKIPVIQTVQDTGEDLDLEDYYAPENMGSEKLKSIPEQKRSIPPPHANRQSARRTRGVSLLPVRQSDEPVRKPGSPPHTPANLNTLSRCDILSSGTPPSVNSNVRLNSNTTPTPITDKVEPSSPVSSHHSVNTPLVDNDRLLNTYISQLAAKEARVGDLRTTVRNLQQELVEAEKELSEFKENGKKLAEIVHGSGSEDEHPTRVQGRRPSVNEKDVIGLGKRVVDEIGSQFWSFFEDVKSATMGNVEFEHQQILPRTSPALPARPSRSLQEAGSSHCSINSQRSFGQGQHYSQMSTERSRSPPRRQLSPKKSIQNFIRNRSPSPIRNPLSSSLSPKRQELAEQHASQRVKESERLSKKLSHIDLRAPTAVYPTNYTS